MPSTRIIAALAITMAATACGRTESKGVREANPDEYALAVAMMRACPPIMGRTRQALKDGILDVRELAVIRRSYGRAYENRNRAVARNATLTEAGMRPGSLPPRCDANSDTDAGDIGRETRWIH